MKTLNTYMAPGLRELRLVAYAGSAWLTIEFKGGRTGGYGNYAALHTTSDRSMQHIIEHSPEFRSGRIVLLQQQKISDSDGRR